MTDHIYWKNGVLYLLDQRELPFRKTYVKCSTAGDVITAINNMTVRGAPLLGIVAAYGMVLGVKEVVAAKRSVRRADIDRIAKKLGATRPTAVNLFWAIDRMERRFEKERDRNPGGVADGLVNEALAIFREDIAANEALGRHGAALVPDGARILTHCNAGALATAGYGTALGVVRAARDAGKTLHVFIDETRPVLQGARLTAWEMQKENIPATLVTDGMAGALMARGKVDLVITGADRIAANGDTANKIGTYTIAVLAREHGLPFYVAAPLSTVDRTLAGGADIPVEERDPGEVTCFAGRLVAPEGIAVWNPAFDITPGRLITAIVTEKGILRPPFDEALQACFDETGGS